LALLDTPAFDTSPDPENPGWYNWQMTDPTRYNGQTLGKMIVRSEGDGKARLRMYPQHRHSNLSNNVHGGTTLGFIDVALDAEVELLKETRRLLFLRGLVVQCGDKIAAFSGTIRKPTSK
jgi:hypothetical protein